MEFRVLFLQYEAPYDEMKMYELILQPKALQSFFSFWEIVLGVP